MRSIIIPAQITTVEDKIAGNLSLSQLFLLLIPVFSGAVSYILFPPTVHIALYKVLFIVFVSIVFIFLAIRVKGRLILQWLIIISRFNMRPKYYVFNKNSPFARTMDMIQQEKKQRKFVALPKLLPKKRIYKTPPNLALQSAVELEALLANPNYSVRYITKKGRAHVIVQEVK